MRGSRPEPRTRLGQLNPTADLTKLPIDEAHRRLGMVSLTKVVTITIAVCFLLVALAVLLVLV